MWCFKMCFPVTVFTHVAKMSDGYGKKFGAYRAVAGVIETSL